MSRVLCPILVGRDDLLELADRRIAEVAHGRGQALLISGPAGLGKTRLLRAIIRKAVAAGFRVDGGSVSPQDSQVPLASIRDFANGIRANDAFGTLSQDLLAIDGGRDSDGLGTRRLIVRDTADRILDAIDRPTMLVFEDLHWTDEVSLEVIGELARHIGERPLLLIGGYRADEFPSGSLHREWRSRLLNQRYAEEVRLRPLTLDETGIAMTLIIGGELPAPRDAVQAVHERTNGIPLHIEELLAALDDDARSDGRRIREADVPDTIGDAVLARIARLSDEARTVARAGAVVGRCFSPDVIAGMVDRPLAELEPTLDELVDAAILHPFAYVDKGYYDFRHQLLRDAIYGSVPPSQLRRFHAQAAEFVMSLEGVEHHPRLAALRAGGPPLAGVPGIGRRCSRVAPRRAPGSEQFELLPPGGRQPAGRPARRSREPRCTRCTATRRTSSSITTNRAGPLAWRRRLFLAAGSADKAVELRLNLWSSKSKGIAPRADLIRDLDDILEAVRALPATDSTAAVERWTLALRAQTLLDGSDFGAARVDVAEIRQFARQAGDDELLLEADLIEEQLDVVTGRPASSMDAGFRAAGAARDAGYESTGVTGYRNLAVLAARVLDYPTARRAFAEGLRYADAIEASHCRQQMAVTRAHLAWAEGRWDEADDLARREVAERGCRLGALDAQEVVGCVAATRGQSDNARRWLDDALESARITDHIQRILPAIWALAELELADGDATASLARCEEALELATAKQEGAAFVPFIVTGTRAALAARRPELAERWLARATARVAAFERVAAPAIAHATGLLQLAGSAARARESLTEAVAGWIGLGRIVGSGLGPSRSRGCAAQGEPLR